MVDMIAKTTVMKHVKFLNKYKHLVGLQGWDIRVSTELLTADHVAEADPNIYEQKLNIQLSQDFLDKSEEEQESVLIHELIHGRIAIFQKIVEELTSFEEERLANDLERGFFSLIKHNKKINDKN